MAVFRGMHTKCDKRGGRIYYQYVDSGILFGKRKI